MQMNATTDYAIRILVYLAVIDRLATSREIASKMGIPVKYITTVTQELKNCGFISSQQGNNGGYILRRKPEEITLRDVVFALEDGIKLSRCTSCDPNCFLYDSGNLCEVHRSYSMVETVVENVLGKITIEELSRMQKDRINKAPLEE